MLRHLRSFEENLVVAFRGSVLCSRLAPTRRNGLVRNHLCDGLAVYFLFRCVDLVRLQIYREAVHCVLHTKVFKLVVVVRIVLLKNRNGATVASSIDSPQPWIELDDVWSACHRQKGNCLMLIEIEHCHQIVPFAG